MFLATEWLTKNYGPLAQCRVEMEELEKKLKPVKDFRALDQMLKWPPRESNLTKRLAKLNRFKSTLIISIIDQTWVELIIEPGLIDAHFIM